MFLPGSDSNKPSLGEKLLIGVVILIAVRVFLPTVAGWVLDVVSEVTTTAERLALPAAIAAGFLGALIMLSPLHRTHGGKMVGGAFVCAALAGLLIPALTWVSSNIPSLATDAVAQLAHAFGG